ncbi:hypothetical protein J4441_00860 [Candidatus Micrarchaeota archaeon]|nr:hypothetical protein [Candidatus Micrarchaeota archaeon]
MVGKSVLALFFALLFASVCAAASCEPATSSVNLAAVLEDGGGAIVPLEVEVRPGSGKIYTSIEPKTGIGTQQSQEIAANFAFGGKNLQCDVLYRIRASDGTAYVDGPSAGAAMALALKAALEGREIRDDIVITGTISEKGEIGEVGGIVEKAIASAKAGKKGILTPKQQIYEHVVLSTLKRDYGFTAREVLTFEEAGAIAFAPSGSEIEEKFEVQSEPLPEGLQPIEKDMELEIFSAIAASVIEEVRQDLKESGEETPGDLGRFVDYFESEIAKYEKLNEMGYAYTSANSAFLLGIESEFLKVGSREIDIVGSKSDVEACLASVRIPKKTNENFYWVTGATLRKLWGERKLADTAKLIENSEVKYPLLHELLFAQSWCTVASQLAAAKEGGQQVDESLLAVIAQEKISEANEAFGKNEPDADARWHLEIATDALSKAQYAEAMFDATYAKVMVEARAQMLGDAPLVREKAAELAQQNRSSLWGKVYSGQAKYIYALEPTSLDAYRLLRFSQELDVVAQQIDARLEVGTLPVQGPENAQPAVSEGVAAAKKYNKLDLAYALGLLVLVWAFGAGILFNLWKGSRAG